MNEVTTIHLGRQSFTIAADAHKELRAYLTAIKHQVGPNAAEVIEEVELRMAELLAEHGIAGEKVVLAQDIDFLKEQLGEPRDFKEEDTAGEASGEPSNESGPKRLFRDPKQAWFAGVAAGISAYLGLPVLLIRALFIVLTFSGGIGILAYLLLWLVMPEAKSPADFLQMHGRAVTVDSIKEVIDRADLPAAARRASNIVERTGSRLAKLILAVFGSGLLLASIGLLAAAATATSYLFMHGAQITGTTVFPVGHKEHYLVICTLMTMVFIALLLAITGRAVFSRRWAFPTWATAAVIVCLVGSISVGTALSFAVEPAISQRYNQLHHHEIRQLPAFTSVHLRGNSDLPVSFQYASDYSVEIDSLGKVDTSPVKISVTNGVLNIDSTDLKTGLCRGLCFGGENIQLIVRSPLALQGEDGPNGNGIIFRQTLGEPPM